MAQVIQVKNLSKYYGKLKAVDNATFSVEKGEVFGLLGENGAGKTTTLEIIEGLRKATSGNAKVLNLDVEKNLSEIKKRIGVQLQSSAYYEFLKLREILDLFGSFYPKQTDSQKLFKMVALQGKADQYVQNLSGGQKQRFSIIASLINDPEIVFLDEPTTGLDPVARRNTWDIISQIKAQGKTIILTTHYMEEAEILCDHIAIMEKGKIVAQDETHKLIERTKHPFKINFILAKDNPSLIKEITSKCKMEKYDVTKFPGKETHYELKLKTQNDLNVALALVQKQNPESLTISKASLEDLFIELTGKTIEDETENVND